MQFGKYYLILILLFVSCSNGYYYKYWFFPYYENNKIDTTNREGFTILDRYFAKDNDHIYYKENRLTDIDPKSFQILNHTHFSDKKSVYYISTQTELKTNSPKAWIIIIPLDLKVWTEDKLVLVPLEDSDPKTFQILKSRGLDTDYGTDEKHLYYEGIKLEERNKDSVGVLDSKFYDIIKTKNSIYYKGEKIKDADPETFLLYDSYAKDKRGCYYFNVLAVHAFSCNTKDFKPLTYPNPLDSKISMDSDYAKDDASVFWQGVKIKQADAKSFRLDVEKTDCLYPGMCGKDKNFSYESGQTNSN
ncbi:hypothetical protein EHS11_02310 [Leptospira ilyithenensis]|uniref:DKNYY family protein n=2 Tax=Leptospira ilyithenensis TaxID=2484901 RepID=A0A4R9LX97_9LEPT|nr:DKNYY domain-containing protein [Leptospira ilyithenensis]TGN14329.1 hypothetical protein EHS11_02310 [Leptospira ilyithenensis]